MDIAVGLGILVAYTVIIYRVGFRDGTKIGHVKGYLSALDEDVTRWKRFGAGLSAERDGEK